MVKIHRLHYLKFDVLDITLYGAPKIIYAHGSRFVVIFGGLVWYQLIQSCQFTLDISIVNWAPGNIQDNLTALVNFTHFVHVTTSILWLSQWQRSNHDDAKSIETRCLVENEEVVGAAPTGDAPTTSEWSTILLPTKVRIILEVWRK